MRKLICISVVCMFIVLLFALQKASATMSIYPGDQPGMNYRNFDLPSDDPTLCSTECDKDVKCKAYTYVKPGYQGSKARCWLKSDIPAVKQNSCCISGTKMTSAAGNKTEWYKAGSNRPSCLELCQAKGKKPVAGGIHPSGNWYHVCAAEPGGEMTGWRIGYNLAPDWSRACYVGQGGKEIGDQRYDCLCSDEDIHIGK
jgi:hypothetical protein